MGYNHVKTATGWIIIAGHFGLAVLALVVLGDVLDSGDIVNVILLLAPLTMAYFTAVVINFIADKFSHGPGRRVNANFAGISLLLPAALIAFVGWIILRYPSDIADDVTTLQRWIGAVEAVIGTTVGLVVNDLFPTKRDDTPPNPDEKIGNV